MTMPISYQQSGGPTATATRSDNHVHNVRQQQQQHLKTYRAGEDGNRLAEIAKEFGLERQRQPRKQIREKSPIRRRPAYATAIMNRLAIQLDHSIEVAQMRAVYARQRHTKTTTTTTTTPALEVDPAQQHWHLDDVGVVWSAEQQQQQQQQQQSTTSNSDMPEWLEQIEQEEEDLHAHGVGGDLTSSVQGIIKGMVGPAILYLPHGLAKSGYALAIPIMLLVTVLFLFSCQCLLDSWKLEHSRLLQCQLEQERKEGKDDLHSQQNTTEEKQYDGKEGGTETKPLLKKAIDNDGLLLHHHKRTFFLSYPELAYRAYGLWFEQLVKLGITLMQSCVCLTYLIFVPQNLSKVVQLLWGKLIAPEWFLLVMIAVQVPLSWIRDIRKLTATNLLANLLILYGLVVCIVLSLQQATSASAANTGDEDDNEDSSPIQILAGRFQNLAPFGNDWFMFIGTSVFMFEGSITVLVPLQEAVFTEEDRKKFPAVNCYTTLCIIAFYIFFSVTCWMALGDDVRTVLTTSLPPGPAATSVQLAYSIAVIFTFPLQNYPALEIACRCVVNIMDKYSACGSKTDQSTISNEALQHNLTSSVLVVLLALVAATTMNSLDKVVSFLGGLLGAPIAFIFPPLVHLRLAGRAGTLSTNRKIMNILVALMGFVAMILSTVTTLLPST